MNVVMRNDAAIVKLSSELEHVDDAFEIGVNINMRSDAELKRQDIDDGKPEKKHQTLDDELTEVVKQNANVGRRTRKTDIKVQTYELHRQTLLS